MHMCVPAYVRICVHLRLHACVPAYIRAYVGHAYACVYAYIRAARLQDVFIRSGRPEIRVPRLVSRILVLRTGAREGFVPHRGTPCHGRGGSCLVWKEQLPCRNGFWPRHPPVQGCSRRMSRIRRRARSRSEVKVAAEFRARSGTSSMAPDAGGQYRAHLESPAKDRP